MLLLDSGALERWITATQRKEMTLVTAGRAGVGKSSLTRNLLRLTDENSPLCQHSPSPLTKDVKVYTSLREGEITVRVIDAPGLTELDVNDSKAMAEIQERTGGKCDLLLYCVSLLPDSKIDKKDEKIVRKLTHVFGEGLWERAALVLTFANTVKVLNPDQSIEDLVNDYGQKFQSVLRRVCPSFSVVSIFSCRQHQCRSSSTIVALPAGGSPGEQFVDSLPVGWDESIFLEVLERRSVSSVPVVFKANYPDMQLPKLVRVPLLFGGLVIGTAVPTGIGAAICVYFGTAVGLFLKQFVKHFDLFRAQKVGLLIGISVVGPWAALQIIPSLQEYEAEQSELEEIQKKVKEYRKNAV